MNMHKSSPEASAPIYRPQSESPAPVYATAVPVENIPNPAVTAYCVAEGTYINRLAYPIDRSSPMQLIIMGD
jgi:hypothetical protein